MYTLWRATVHTVATVNDESTKHMEWFANTNEYDFAWQTVKASNIYNYSYSLCDCANFIIVVS